MTPSLQFVWSDKAPHTSLAPKQTTDSRIEIDLRIVSVQLRFTTRNLNVSLQSDYPSSHIIHAFFGANDLSCRGNKDIAPDINLLNLVLALRRRTQQGQQDVGTHTFIPFNDRRVATRDKLLFRLPVFELIACRDQTLIRLDPQIFTDQDKVLIIDFVLTAIAEYAFIF